MLVRPLFAKYQRALLSFANSSVGKAYLGIRTDNKIVHLSPDGWHELLEKRPDVSTFKATFYPCSPFIKKFRTALTLVETLSWARDFLRQMPDQGAYLIENLLTNPVLAFGLATDTFNPDANPESTSVDGFVSRLSVNEPFSTIRAGAGTQAVDDNTTALLADFSSSGTTNQYDALRREICLFDTSSLPDTAVVSLATISYFVNSITDNFDQSIGVVDSTPASNTALATTDYGNVGTTRQAADIDITSLSTGQYNAWTFNATGRASISTTGVSKFAMRISGDIDNSAPTWSSNTDLSTAANSADAASNKPKLDVTYSLPSAAVTSYSFFM